MNSLGPTAHFYPSPHRDRRPKEPWLVYDIDPNGQQIQAIQSQPYIISNNSGVQNFEASQTSLDNKSGVVFPDSISRVEYELSQHNELFITSAGRVDDGVISIKIHDGNGKTLYNAQVQSTSRLISAHAHTIQMGYRARYTILDYSGIEVMRVQQEVMGAHVSLLGRLLGFVQTEDTCSTSFIVCNSSRGFNLHIRGNDNCCLSWNPCFTKPNFRIISNGEDIGGIETSCGNGPGNSCAMRFPKELDIQSKGLLIMAAIMIYVGYFGKTGCGGKSGTRGKGCTWSYLCVGFCAFLVLALLVVMGVAFDII